MVIFIVCEVRYIILPNYLYSSSYIQTCEFVPIDAYNTQSIRDFRLLLNSYLKNQCFKFSYSPQNICLYVVLRLYTIRTHQRPFETPLRIPYESLKYYKSMVRNFSINETRMEAIQRKNKTHTLHAFFKVC